MVAGEASVSLGRSWIVLVAREIEYQDRQPKRSPDPPLLLLLCPPLSSQLRHSPSVWEVPEVPLRGRVTPDMKAARFPVLEIVGLLKVGGAQKWYIDR